MEYIDGINDIYVVGRLLSQDKLHASSPNKDNIFVFSMNNSMHFLVEPSSDLPYGFINVPYFQISADFLDDEFKAKDYSYQERIPELEKYLSDKLIIFKPFRRREYNNVDRNTLSIIPRPVGDTDNTKYSSIPLFSEKDKIKKTLFENLLLNEKRIPVKKPYSTDENDSPEFVIWEEGGDLTVYGFFSKMNHSKSSGILFSLDRELRKCRFKDEWLDRAVPSNDYEVIFIDSGIYLDIKRELEAGEVLKPENVIDEVSVVNDEYTVDTNGVEAKTGNEKPDEISEEDKENMFLNRFIDTTESNLFVYDKQDLVNFHVSMKMSNLVILAGMSGTGKSKLVSLYGKSLGLSDEQIKIIPVKASWTDDADLLGYLDTENMLYRPSETGLVDTLMKANNRENIYFVCFDEMNLSRVEHYFSQFLSILENNTGKRILQLYNPELENRVYNSSNYPAQIELGDNLYFIGTVNIDESTYHFSDKTLDRANVIRLNVCPFEKLKELSDNIKRKRQENTDNLKERNIKNPTLTALEFKEFRNIHTNEYIDLSDEEIAFLKELHLLLSKTKPDFGIGFRIIRQIDDYLKNIPDTEWLSRRAGIDLQICQRILPKIRGSEEQLSDLFNLNESDYGNSIYALLEKYSSISDFTATMKILEYKAKELKANGYTA